MNVEIDDLKNIDAFGKIFDKFFCAVRSAFVARDIHFSWIDVKYNFESTEESVEKSEGTLKLSSFESKVKSLGWGFCSTDSITSGSSLVPFGLIYPTIGIPSSFLDCNNYLKRTHAQLSLEILDVSGKPLECKFCDLHLLSMDIWPTSMSDDVPNNWDFANLKPGNHDNRNSIWSQFSDGSLKLHVNSLRTYDKGVRTEARVSRPILVNGFSGKYGESQRKSHKTCSADRILEQLAVESGEFMAKNSIPTWQVLLTFLYREGYWAWVSLSSGSRINMMGILQPLTVHSAILSVVPDCGGSKLGNLVTKTENKILKQIGDKNKSNGFKNSQSQPEILNNEVAVEDGQQNKHKKRANEHSQMDLVGISILRYLNHSKKMKFLKCWMKQIKKSSPNCISITDGSKPQQGITLEIEERTVPLKKIEQLMSSSISGSLDSLIGGSTFQQEAGIVSCSETMEAFLNSTTKKIQDAIEAKGVEMVDLAERLVSSSICWLCQKHELEKTTNIENSEIRSNDADDGMIVAELRKLLLKEPKDLVAKHKDKDSLSHAYDPEFIVREYELQIFFRMEILRSEVAAGIKESTKQKFVKQICSLLDIIQYHVGGFFGDESLESYVGRTLKSRYSETLKDMVHRIYTRMDFLLFADEDESPNLLLNSEDSNQSWRDILEKDYMGNEMASAEDESSDPISNNNDSVGITREQHAYSLMLAQERRERARRFASSTSWVPDLQRVWAPKQPKLMRPKTDSLWKISKRKEWQKTNYDVVCETPMSGKRHSCPRGSSIRGDNKLDFRTNSFGSVPKALFQDN